MEGTYRVLRGGQQLLERFVAAPGPAGWRYFGRQYAAGSFDEPGAERLVVDHVVDAAWGLVRLRLLDVSGERLEAQRGEGGVLVSTAAADGSSGETLVPAATLAWSPSPSSLLVAHAMWRSSGRLDVVAAAVEPGAAPRPVALTFPLRREHEQGAVSVQVDGKPLRYVPGEEALLSADGWFELAAEP